MEYSYLGYTGERQIVKGKVSAVDERAAVDILSNIGYRVVSLKPAGRFLSSTGSIFKPKVKPAEMVTFSRQLALLLESGVGVIQALELLQSQTMDNTLRRVLYEIVNNLRGGKSLSVALSQHPSIFSSLYCKLISVGEQTGALETVLRSMGDYIERQSQAVGKVRQALMYPAIVLILAIAVGALMMGFLLKPVIDMFSKLGGTLPLPTRMLVGGMQFIESYGLLLLIVIIAIAVVAFLYFRTPNGRFARDRWSLRMPMLGRLFLITELARICRSLSLLFKAGLPLPEVMTLTTRATGNRVIAQALGVVEHDMLRGQGIAKPMSRSPIFLPLMVEMTKVGEETGNLDESLVIVAENFEIEADRRIQTLLGLIEPVMTIGMGLVVGFLAMAVFMPIYGALNLVG
jgi:type IV pilus assembly protein PilC